MPMVTLREVFFCFMTDEEWATYDDPNIPLAEREAVHDKAFARVCCEKTSPQNEKSTD